jgi:hypothetical protein
MTGGQGPEHGHGARVGYLLDAGRDGLGVCGQAVSDLAELSLVVDDVSLVVHGAPPHD